jgi:ElaB/YqjD/DUF883 family membrane-anchored ribosome-binding protein
MTGETPMVEKAEYQKDLDNLKNDLSQLRTDLAELVSSVKELGKQSASGARNRAQEEFEHRAQQASDAYQAARSQANEAAEHVQHSIEERPFTAAAIAFGVGVVVGKLFSRD